MPKVNLSLTGAEYDALRAFVREGVDRRGARIEEIERAHPGLTDDAREAQGAERKALRLEARAGSSLIEKIEAD